MRKSQAKVVLSSFCKPAPRNIAFLGLLAVVLFYLSGHYLYFLAMMGVWTIVFIVAIKRPHIFTSALIILYLLPLFMQTLNMPWEEFFIAKGLNWIDLFNIVMVLSCIYFYFIDHYFFSNNRLLFRLICIFALFLFFEIVRNLKAYGLSAPGEFRNHYLIMITLFYVALSNRNPSNAIRVFKLSLFLALVLPICLFPTIGVLRGWNYGPENRFFYASVSLGTLYGLLGMLLGYKYRLIKPTVINMILLTIISLFLIVIDSHRSVWITLITIVMLLFLFREIRFFKGLMFIIPLLLMGLLLAILTNATGFDMLSYLSERGHEIFSPGTEGTAFWRLSVWKAQLENFIASPFIGEGFGGYWSAYVPEFNAIIDVAPHSLYVQTLVKLGVFGLALYLAIVSVCAKKLYTLYKYLRVGNHPLTVIVLVSLVVLLSSHVYYAVYAFEPYSFLFSGIGLSLALRSDSIIEAVQSDVIQL